MSSSPRIACKACGVSILIATAERNDGICEPCRLGTRATLGEVSRQLKEEARDPARIYWLALVDRVHGTAGGFETLSRAEQIYWAVNLLEGETHNGGLEQFFFNSSGAHYEDALLGLTEMKATESLRLCREAKQLLFGEQHVPTDTRKRRAILRKSESPKLSAALDALDQQFYQDVDKLTDKIQAFAKTHRLY